MTFYLYMTISRPDFTAKHCATSGWSDPPTQEQQSQALVRMRDSLRFRFMNLPGYYDLDGIELVVVNDKGRHTWGRWKNFDEVSLEQTDCGEAA